MFKRPGQTFEEKSLREVIYEIRDEVRDFATTRYEMLMAELREKTGRIKTAIPLLLGGAMFAIGAIMPIGSPARSRVPITRLPTRMKMLG